MLHNKSIEFTSTFVYILFDKIQDVDFHFQVTAKISTQLVACKKSIASALISLLLA